MLDSITSPSGTVYSFEYDGFGNVTKTWVGSRELSENTYNTTRGLLTYTEYGNGAKVGYTYDTLDRVTEKLYNDVVKVKFRYDKFGNLYEKQDLFTNTTYRYNYDLTGRIIGVKGSNGIGLDYVYDNLNRISKYATTMGGITNTTEYVYGSSDIAGQLDGILYGVKQNGADSIVYTYDSLARLNTRTLKTTTPFETHYTYLEGGTQGTTTTMVKTVENDSGKYEYSYDQLGNITDIILNGNVYESYEYDHLGQLTKVTRGGEEYTYTYNNGGNIQSVKKDGTEIKNYTYGDATWKDLLTSFNGQEFDYDDIGNPLIYRDGFNFTWSNGRQLTGVTKGTDTISYLYNADGLRTSKTVNGTTTDYYWLNGVLLGQKTGNDYITYLYDENGSAYGLICNNSYYYYVFNVQGDVVGIIDNGGSVVAKYSYDAWGNILGVTNGVGEAITETDHIANINPIRYRGYYYDSETGFYYLQSRYYDPVTQRFLNADSLLNQESVLGLNMFAYCLNNPVNMTDTTGYLPFFAITAAAGAVLGAVAGGIIAANTGGNVWAGIGIGAAAGALIGTGVGMAAGVALAGSITASTAAVVSGAGMLATAVSTSGVGTGLALVADNISRASNNVGTVLYSGGEQARQAAATFANNTGGTIIDNTVIGKVADVAARVPGADFKTVWSQASATFCNQASGEVNAFISNSAYRGVDSIFWSVEMPALLNNPRVTEIIIHVFE